MKFLAILAAIVTLIVFTEHNFVESVKAETARLEATTRLMMLHAKLQAIEPNEPDLPHQPNTTAPSNLDKL